MPEDLLREALSSIFVQVGMSVLSDNSAFFNHVFLVTVDKLLRLSANLLRISAPVHNHDEALSWACAGLDMYLRSAQWQYNATWSPKVRGQPSSISTRLRPILPNIILYHTGCL